MPLFFERVTKVMEDTGEDFEIVCVNDGSKDKTLEILRQYAEQDKRIRVIDFSRNFGREAALTAALDYSKGDAVILIDSDLQQPPEVIPEMLARWREGYEAVFAKRLDRASDSFLRKTFTMMFNKLYNAISSTHLPENVAEFCLMDRIVVDALKNLKESHRFMRGLFAWIGFKTCIIDYECAERAAGQTKFNLFKLLHLAAEGITSFSTAPLSAMLVIGSVIASGAFIYGLYIFISTLIYGIDSPGYASLACLILLFGGLNLIGIGILGEYLGRTYIETKHRPIYLVRKIYEHENKSQEEQN